MRCSAGRVTAAATGGRAAGDRRAEPASTPTATRTSSPAGSASASGSPGRSRSSRSSSCSTSRCPRWTCRSRPGCSTCCEELQDELRAGLPVHRARPVRGAAHQRPDRGDVPGQDRGDGLPATTLFERPRHPYTQALLSAVPVPGPGAGAAARADRADRGRAEPGTTRRGLPVPHPLLDARNSATTTSTGASRKTRRWSRRTARGSTWPPATSRGSAKCCRGRPKRQAGPARPPFGWRIGSAA